MKKLRHCHPMYYVVSIVSDVTRVNDRPTGDEVTVGIHTLMSTLVSSISDNVGRSQCPDIRQPVWRELIIPFLQIISCMRNGWGPWVIFHGWGQVSALSSLRAMMLLVRLQVGHPACTNLCHLSPLVLLWNNWVAAKGQPSNLFSSEKWLLTGACEYWE